MTVTHLWSEQDQRVVFEALGEMFTIFGGGTPERIKAFSRELREEAYCPTCVAAGIRVLNGAVTRLPMPTKILEAYTEQMNRRHQDHANITNALEYSIGEQETWWRTVAREQLERITRDRVLALFIAAQMWWNRVPPTEHDVSEEIRERGRNWLGGAKSFLKGRAEPPEVMVERAFLRARRMATVGEDALTDDEVQLRGFVPKGPLVRAEEVTRAETTNAARDADDARPDGRDRDGEPADGGR